MLTRYRIRSHSTLLLAADIARTDRAMTGLGNKPAA